MKKLRKNSGFTLVECIVAMAVLAVMTLGLMMILSVTVKQRNLNTQMEREVDNQVEKVLQGGEDVAAEDIEDGDIVFKNKDKDVFTLTGGQKVYYKDGDAELQIGQLKYDVGGTPTKQPSEEKKENDDSIVVTESRKVYGITNLKDNIITVNCDTAKTELLSDGYYSVRWVITLEATSVYQYAENITNTDQLMGLESLKVALPENVKVTDYKPIEGSCKFLHMLGNNTLRIELNGTSATQVYVTFKIKTDDYEKYAKGEEVERDGKKIKLCENNFIADHFGTTAPEKESK